MSGIAIDVQANTATANQQLAEINRKLTDLVRNSQNSIKALNGFNNSKSFKDISSASQLATRDLDKLGKTGVSVFGALQLAASRTAGVIFSLPVLIGAVVTSLAAMKGVSTFSRFADELTTIDNKLRMVAKAGEDTLATQTALYQLSRESYSAFVGTADIYFNFARAMQSSAVSSKEFLAVTRTVQQAIALSNVSAESAAAAMTQLNQGLSAGALRGDELNSVMEQIPRLQMMLSQSLDMTSGKLRDFAATGGVSTEIFFNAMRQQAEIIQKEFDATHKTVAQAFGQIAEVAKHFVQVVNSIGSSSTGWTSTIDKMTSSIDATTANIVPKFYLMTQGAKNFFDSLEMFTGIEKTIRDVFDFKISVFDAKGVYTEYETIRKYVNEIKKLLGKNISVPTKIFGIETDFSKIFANFKLPSFSSMAPEIEKVSRSLLDMITLVLRTGVAIGYAIGGLTSKFHYLVPDIRRPLETFQSQFNRFMTETSANLFGWAYQLFTPLKRATEGMLETLSLYLLGDTQLERAWSRVFRSKDIDSFISGLYRLGSASRSIRFADFSIIWGDIRAYSRGIMEDGTAILRYFGIVENRLIWMNNIRFDRLIGGFRTLSTVINMLWVDILFPKFVLSLAKVYGFFVTLLADLSNAIKANLTFASGEELGKNLARGAYNGMRWIVTALNDLIKGSTNTTFGVVAKTFGSQLKDSLVSFGKWLLGFFKGVFSEVGTIIQEAFSSPVEVMMKRAKQAVGRDPNSKVDNTVSAYYKSVSERVVSYSVRINPTNFEKAMHWLDGLGIKIVDKTYGFLKTTEKIIQGFGHTVQNVFAEIYDKVVGHSWWPETIDGINDYTKKIFESNNSLDKFTTNAANAFVRVRNFIKVAATTGKEYIINVRAKLAAIDYGMFGHNLAQVVQASILAVFLLIFGNSTLRLIAADFLLSSLSDGLLRFMGGMPTAIGAALSESAGFMAATVANSLMTGMTVVIEKLPTFLGAFVSGLGPIGKAVTDLFSKVPSNGLLNAVLFGSALYAWKAKSGVKDITQLVTGVAATGKKPGKAGIIDYGASILGMNNLGAGRGTMFSRILGNNPALLLTGIAAVSSAFLSSISLLESSVVGIPLITLAIFGREGGGRMIREFFTFIPNLFKGAAKPMAAAVASGPLSSAFKVMGRDLGKMWTNAVANSGDYGAGNLSFSDMFMRTARTATSPSNSVKLKQHFMAFWAEVMQFEIGGVSLRSSVNAGIGLKNAFVNAFQAGGTVFNMWVLLKNNAAQAFKDIKTYLTPLGQAFSGTWSTIKTGFVGLLSMMTSKIGIFVILAAVLSSIAFAASSTDDAQKGLGETFMGFVKILAVSIAGLFTFGAVLSAVSKGISTFRALQLADKMMPSLATGVSANFGHALTAAGLSIRNSFMLAVNAVMLLGRALIDVVVWTYVFATETMLSAQFWTKIGGAIMLIARPLSELAVAIKDLTVAKLLVEFVALKGAIKTAFAFLTSGAVITTTLSFIRSFSAAVALKGLLWTSANMLPGWLTTLIRGIAWVVSGLASITGLLVGAGIVATGALGLWLFGPGDTIGETLDIYRDKISGLFGATPSSNIGRANALKAIIPDYTGPGVAAPKLTSDQELRKAWGSPDTKGVKASKLHISDENINFSASIDKIDFSKMEKIDYELFLKVSQTTEDTVTKMRELVIRQGELSSEQKDELDAALKLRQSMLKRAPQKDETNLFDTYKKAQSQILNVDNSTWAGLNRVLGALGEINREYLTELFGKDFIGIVAGWADNFKSSLVGAFVRANIAVVQFVTNWDGFAQRLEDFQTRVMHPLSWDKTPAEIRQSEVKGEPISVYSPEKSPSNVVKFVSLAIAGIETAANALWKRDQEAYNSFAKAVPTPESLKNDEFTKDSINRVGQVHKGLEQADIIDFNRLIEQYGDATERLNKLRDTGPGGRGFIGLKDRSSKGWAIELGETESEARSLESEIYRLSKQLADVGADKLELDAYTKAMSSLSGKVKDFSGVDFGKNQRDWLGKDEQKLNDLVYGYRVYDDMLTKTGRNSAVALPIKIKMIDIKEQIKSLTDQMTQAAFFGKGLEFQIKTTGIDTTKEALANFYATNQEGYDKFHAAYEEVLAAQTAFDGLTIKGNKSSTAEIGAALDRLIKAKQEASAAAPSKSYFTEIADQITKLGISGSLEMKQFIYLSETSAKELTNKLRDAGNLKKIIESDNFNKKPWKEQIKAISELVTKARELEGILARSAKVALEGQLKDPNLDAGQKAAILSAATGKTAPDAVARNPILQGRWNDLVKRIKDEEEIQNSKLRSSGNQVKNADGSVSGSLVTPGLTDTGRAESSARLMQLKKQLAIVEGQLPDSTTSSLLTEIAAMKAPFDFPEFKLVDPDFLGNLIRDARRLAELENLGTLGKLDSKGYSEIADLKSTRSNMYARGYQESSLKSSADAVQRYATAGFTVDTSTQFSRLKGSKEAAVLTGLLADTALQLTQKAVPEEEQARLRGVEADAKAAVKQLDFKLADSDTLIKQFNEAFVDANLTAEVLSRWSSAEFEKATSGFAAAKTNEEIMKNLGTSPADLTKKAEGTRAQQLIQRQMEDLVNANSFTGRGMLSMKRAGVDVTKEQYSNVSAAGDTLLRGMADALGKEMYMHSLIADKQLPEVRQAAVAMMGKKRVELNDAIARETLGVKKTPGERISANLKDVLDVSLEPGVANRISSVDEATINAIAKQMKILKITLRDDTLSEIARLSAENRIAALDVELQYAIKNATMKREDTQVYQAGQSFASNMKSSFVTGVKEMLGGSLTYAETIHKIGNGIADTVIANFVDGMASALFRPKGILDKLFTGMGSTLFQTASDLFGGNKEKDYQVAAMNDLTTAIDSLATIFSDFASGRSRGTINADGTVSGQSGFIGDNTDLLQGQYDANGNLLAAYADGSQQIADEQQGTTGAVNKGAKETVGALGSLGNLLKTIGINTGLSQVVSAAQGAIGTVASVLSIASFFGAKKASGGFVYGPGSGTSDSIPTMLSTGEFVVNAKSAMQYKGILTRINSNQVPHFAMGGFVSSTPISIAERPNSSNQSVFNISITGDVSRQTRTEIQRMIPQIATGVNMHNFEQGRGR